MHASNPLIFDITNNDFHLYSGSHPGAERFSNVGIAGLSSFSFTLGYQVAVREASDQPLILLDGLNGTDVSALTPMGAGITLSQTTNTGAAIVLSLGHNGVYTLSAASGTLAGLDTLDFEPAPFRTSREAKVDRLLLGDEFRTGYEVVYADSADPALFNNGDWFEVEAIPYSTGDTFYRDGVALVVDGGEVNASGGSANDGQIRLVTTPDGVVLQYRDVAGNSSQQVITQLIIENGAGEQREAPAVFLDSFENLKLVNSGDPFVVENVVYTAGDTFYQDGVALVVDGGWVPSSDDADNFGQIRLVTTDAGVVLEFQDRNDGSARPYINALTIEDAAGGTTDVPTIFLDDQPYVSVSSNIGTDVTGMNVPTAMMADMIRLMPLTMMDNFDADGDTVLDGLTVTPTHVAAQNGDWNDGATWANGIVPDDGAIVHIPMGVTVTASGDVSSGAHIFMTRVDGVLEIGAPSNAQTSMLVDTVFVTHIGQLDIDAQGASDGTIDIVIQGYDLTTPPVSWDSATAAYYTPDAIVNGIGATNANVTDGTGVLGRFAWDPEQLSLGVVSMGAAHVHGQDKTAHIAHDGLQAGATSIVVTGSLADLGWAVDDRLLIAGTNYAGNTTDGLVTGPTDLSAKDGQDEVVRIAAITDLGNGQVQVTFDTALVHDHTPPNFANDAIEDPDLNIANLSRNITIRSGAATTAADSDIWNASSIDQSDPVGQGATPPNPLGIGHLAGEPVGSAGHHYVTERGHLMFMHNDDVTVENVALRAMGRTDKTAVLDDIAGGLKEDTSSKTDDDVIRATDGLSAMDDPANVVNMTGRYALHLHQAGTAAGDGETGAMIAGNVVENAVGWGYTQHGTEALLLNNISYDVVGAGFMAETGDETGVWYNNLSVANHGFMTFQNDPQKQATNNDLGRNGTGFWTEGRAIAIIDNTAVSSKQGFTVQPFGVKQVTLESAALSDYDVFFAAVNTKLGLTGDTALTVNADEVNGELELLAHGTDHIIQNGFMPIRYFTGNTVIDADVGLSIITSNEHASRKLNDAWSTLSDFTAAHVGEGVFVQYASKYVFEDFKILGLNQLGATALELSTSSNEVTATNWHVEGFLGDTIDQTLRVGIRHSRFADHWAPADFPQAYRDSVDKVNGYGPLQEMWDGFDHPLNPFENLYDNSFFNFQVQNAWETTSSQIGSRDFVQQRALRENLDYMPEDYSAQTGSFSRFGEDIPVERAEGVSVDLIFQSNELGLVAEWREHFNTFSHYTTNFGIKTENDPATELDDTYDFEIPLFYFNDVYNERSNGYGPQGLLYNQRPDDVWSGTLVEFDKTDSLGTKRYAYEVRALVDENGVQLRDVGGIISAEDAENGVEVNDGATGNPLFREHVTTNERLVFTKDQISATLASDGYFTMAGMSYLAASGVVEDMRFVVMATPLSDRLTGQLDVQRFVVALDENWGLDGSVDWASVVNHGELDRLQDNIVLSESYGHFRSGELIGTPIALSDSTLADGVVSGGSGADVINAGFTGDPGGDLITTGADTIYGRAGNDTITGDRGADMIYGGSGDDSLQTGRHGTQVFGGDGDDTISARLTHNATHTLTGGDGADHFVMLTPNANRATTNIITDFELDVDKFFFDGVEVDFDTLSTDLISFDGLDTIITFAPQHQAIFVGADLPIGNGIVQGTDGNDAINTATTVDVGGDLVTVAADVIYGFGGADTINADRGDDVVYGGVGDDVIYGSRNNNDLFGQGGNDIIDTGRNTSTVSGGVGDDTIRAATNTSVSHILSGDEGADVFEIAAARTNKAANITITDFSVAQDSLFFTVAGNLVQFNFGDLAANVAAGMDFALEVAPDDPNSFRIDFGSEGNDFVTLTNVILPRDGLDYVEGTGGNDRIDNKTTEANGGNGVVEQYDYFVDENGDLQQGASQSGNQTIHSGAGDDVIFTYKGADVVHAGDGDDQVNSSGSDVVYGGNGNDDLISKKGSTLYGGAGDDVLTALFGTNTTYAPETGTNTAHDLTGGAGADIFALFGPTDKSSDVVIRDFSLAENDQLIVLGELFTLADLPDRVRVTETQGYVRLEVFYTAAQAADENATTQLEIYLDGISAITPDQIVQGTNTSDIMKFGYTDDFGDAIGDTNDEIHGFDGNDDIDGAKGNDVILGGDGDDSINGNTGNDTLNGDAGNDTLYGSNGNDSIAGGIGDDKIYGQKGTNILKGEDGNDTINSGRHSTRVEGGNGDDMIQADIRAKGNHTLNGGAGADTFDFVGLRANSVTASIVEDFEVGFDIAMVNGTVVVLTAANPDVVFEPDGSGATLTLDADNTVVFDFL